MKKEGYLFGAMILLISNFLIKILGFLYRVILVRFLGAEGIGLIEMVNPFYTFILVLTTWGIPLAMSKMIAQETAEGNWGNINRIFRLTLILLTASGLITTTLVIYFAPVIVKHFVPDSRIYYCFVTMIPAIFLVAVCSVYRAYFQGTKQISAIGFSQTIEQIIRVIVGLTLTIKLRKYGLEIAVVGVAVASVAGELGGLLFMLAKYHWQKRRSKVLLPAPATSSSLSILKGLFTFGTPVTLTRLLSSTLLTLEASLIPRGLILAGNSMRTATEIYGRYSGVAMTLLHLPSIITMSLAVSVMPAVAELSAGGQKKLLEHRITESLWITSAFTIHSMTILFFYATELCGLVFHAPEAGEALKVLALGGLFCYLQQTMNSILQGLGRVKMLLFNNLCSGLCLILGILLLTPVKGLEIKGAAIALSLSNFTGCTLNIFYLMKFTGIALPLNKIIIKPMISGMISLSALMLLDHWLRPIINNLPLTILLLIGLTSLLYFGILLMIGGLPLHTLKRLPFFNKWLS
ncbi:putative polysaccharide biosynthesis protein [Dehalobacterium formicoaceticum]|uniref:putative polysaccharide biosynthesis protein n=1 Tax=Dehalobacterium formicoaceticum TaxID=51515 RepID=UPI000B7E0048|nr:polysaccharide biosynthesis protein [Dehalobacterium formicoaceticum]